MAGFTAMGGFIAMNEPAKLICIFNFVFLVALTLCTLWFMVGLRRRAAHDARRLSFFSPDDISKDFRQRGFVKHLGGTVLLAAWVGYCAVGYAFMVFLCVGFYALEDNSIPAWPMAYLGGPTSSRYPWLVVFTAVHIVGMLLTMMWDALRTNLMAPAVMMSDATHVMIEEVVAFQTDDDLTDPDILSALRTIAKKLSHRYKRAVARTVVPIRLDECGTRHIEYTCLRYVYRPETDRFHPEGVVEYTPTQAHAALKAGGLRLWEVEESRRRCGANKINVHVPTILEALGSEFADFTYFFNSSAVWGYAAEHTWNMSVLWAIMSLASGFVRSLLIVRPNMRKLAELASLTMKVQVLREGEWHVVEAAELVLGDIFIVDGGGATLPCDGVVVAGSLVVDESMLTGEPMPVQKLPAEDSAQATLSKKNYAYAGTACLQSNGPYEGNKAVMIATAVGSLTTRGQLVRMVLFPASVRFKYNDQLPIVYALMGLFVLFQGYINVRYVEIGNFASLYIVVVNTMSRCLSPMLPVSIVMGQSVSASRLQQEHGIRVLQPGRIPIAGKITMMVFDKTGTITKDGMDFTAVAPIQGAVFEEEIRFDPDLAGTPALEARVPDGLRQALGCCHSVTALADGSLVGNHVEVSMVQTSGWAISDDCLVTSPSGQEVLEVVRRLEFDHCRMTSGVVAKGRGEGLTVYVKGSCEAVRQLCLPETLPANFDAVAEGYAKAGYYVLAVAWKTLPKEIAGAALADKSRGELEAGLSAAGLLLFRNEMKRDSPEAIALLQRARIKSVVCTGDNALTGISVGRQCGIVSPGVKVLLADVGPDGRLEWRDPDRECDKGPVCNPLSQEFALCELAVTQGAWRLLDADRETLDALWARIVVYARMKPEDKINVVKMFQGRDLVTGMCGDGGNDCGSLRAAHAGIALSDAEASMVAPFATGRDGKSLLVVADLIREGRGCLATNLGTFQYFIVYALVVTWLKTWANLRGAFCFPEFMWMIVDVGVGMVMVWTMTQSKAHDILADYRPTATLLGPRTIFAILYPTVSALVCARICFVFLWNRDWYTLVRPLDMGLDPHNWLLRGDGQEPALFTSVMVMTLVTTAYVNTYGGDFRRAIYRNPGVNVCYVLMMGVLFWLVSTPASRFNCLFRVNCDTTHSLAVGEWTFIAMLSAGGSVGGCFWGPEIRLAQLAGLGSWLPSPKEGCEPPAGSNVSWTDPALFPGTAATGCYGPNSCFDTTLRIQVAVVLAIFTVAHHLFAALLLDGHLAARNRLRRRRSAAFLRSPRGSVELRNLPGVTRAKPAPETGADAARV